MEWPFIYPEVAGRPFLSTAEEWVRRTGLAPTFADTFVAGATYGIFMPIWVPRAMTVKRLAVLNGSAVAGNVEVALYEGKLAPVVTPYIGPCVPYGQIVTSGVVAQAGTNQFQIFNTTDQAIAAGMYFLGVQFSSTSAKFLAMVASLGVTDAAVLLMGGARASIGAALPANAYNSSSYAVGGLALPVLALSGVA